MKPFAKQYERSFNYLNRINKNIIIFIVYGLLYDVVMNMYKPFAVKYLERLGGSTLHITLYNCLPGLVAALVLFPCIIILSGFSKKKTITCVFIFISRLCLLGVAFLPAFPADLRPAVFVLIISLMNFPEAISQATMQSLSGSFFDGKVRSMALSLRNQFGNLLVLGVMLISGLIISYVPKTNEQRMLCYQIFFAAAFLIGILEVFYFSKLKEEYNPSYVHADDGRAIKPSKADMKAVFKDKKFLGFAAMTILYYISYHGGWAASSIYLIKNYGANEMWLALFAVVSGLSSFLFASKWNKIIVRKGNDFAMVAACFTMGVNTILLVAAPNLYFLLFQSLVNGIGVIGLNITLLNGLLMHTPDKNRLLYIGAYNTMVNLSLGLSPLCIQIFMDHTSVRTALLLVGVLRFAASFILLYVLFIRNRRNGLKV